MTAPIVAQLGRGEYLQSTTKPVKAETVDLLKLLLGNVPGQLWERASTPAVPEGEDHSG